MQKNRLDMLGITHMGFNRTENRSEQFAWQHYHIIQTLQHTHANWSHLTHDDVDNLCGLDKVIHWLEPVTDIHWYTC